ncbi:MAG TPA: PEP-CTERM sorting domain-containing protein [Candidatus Aquabacterium excrementipullorum]|nr:PEP-CTERM sorting domain-containing protein [Candidatus Aquabacterium excrementipullorum]
MKNIIAAALGAVGALAAPLASAENLFFTNSNVVSLPVARADGTASSANACVKDGVCSSALSFDTATAGVLTVTADDHDGARHDSALVYQSKDVNAGLGVASGYTKNGAFVINDGNDALDSATETLTLHFASAVSVYALYFFPDDRSTYAATHELDRFDGFTLSIDGGKAVEYSFGSLGGQGVSFSTPLTGTTFTLGYAKSLSKEDYYLAGVAFTPAAAVPEAGTFGLMGLGLGAMALAARRRRA